MLLTLGAHQLGHKVSTTVAAPAITGLVGAGAVNVGGTGPGHVWPLGAGAGAISTERAGHVKA